MSGDELRLATTVSSDRRSMAPLTTTDRKKAAVVAAASASPVMDPADRLSKLPLEILAQILSFLPDQEAVRTCVLARTWRHVWKFTTRLLITGDFVLEVQEFVDRLLRARVAGLRRLDGECGPLDVCTIEFSKGIVDEEVAIVNRWIRRALECQVQKLDIQTYYYNPYFRLSNRPFVSPHLKSLDLHGVRFRCSYLDFSGCPALEHLEISHSIMLSVTKMMSSSLKRLVIYDTALSQECRFRICLPHLVSLQLVVRIDRYPVLESMPELEVASMEIYADYRVNCDVCDRICCEHIMENINSGQNTIKCTLLQGLSQVQHLVLTAEEPTYVLGRDFKWCCPTFSKLKTLLIDDHLCGPADCRALVCFLQHAPALEKLTINFCHQQHSTIYNVEFDGYLNTTVESNMMSQCLKTVKIKCQQVDVAVLGILKYLGTLNICFQIRV